ETKPQPRRRVDITPDERSKIDNAVKVDVDRLAAIYFSASDRCKDLGIDNPPVIGMIFNQLLENRRFQNSL
ncbi:MAG: hypothetical protein ACE5H1_07035, partial [Thermodesulfobacteriota bacterium]